MTDQVKLSPREDSGGTTSWQDLFCQRQTAFRAKHVEPFRDIVRVHETLKGRYINLNHENKQLRSQVESLKAELSTTSSAYASSAPANVTKLQSKLLELQDQLTEALRQQNEGVKSRLALSEANQKLKEEHANMTAELSKANSTAKAVSDELERTKQALRDREMQVGTLGEEVIRLRTAVEMKSKEADAVKVENEALLGRMMTEKVKGIEQINSMNNMIENVKKERDRALHTATAQQERIVELTRALAEQVNAHKEAVTVQGPSNAASGDAPSTLSTQQSPAADRTRAPSDPVGAASGIFSWLGRVSTVVSAAADKVATLGNAPPMHATDPGAVKAGTSAPAVMSTSVAGIMSEYVIASLPLPTRVSASIPHVHSAEINCVKFSENSRFVITGGSDGNIAITDVVAGTKQSTLYTSTEGNVVICVDIAGQTIVGGCTDRTVRVWDINTQRLTRSLTGHSGKVHSLCYIQAAAGLLTTGAPSRGMLFSAGADRMIKLWDLRDGRCVKSIDAKSIVNAISISQDGTLIACGNQDSGVRLFDVRSGAKVVENLSTHSSAVTSVCFSRNDGSARLLSASRDNTLRLFDGKTLESLRAFMPTSSTLGSSTTGVSAVLDRVKGTGADGSSLEGSLSSSSLVMKHPSFRIPMNTSRATLSPNGQFAIAGATNGHIYAWAADTGSFEEELGKPRRKSGSRLRENSALASDITSTATPDAITTALDSMDPDRDPHGDSAVYGVDWSNDGRYIASGDDKGRLVVWTSNY